MSSYIVVGFCLLTKVPGMLSDEYCNSGYPHYKYTRCNGYCCTGEVDGCCEEPADIPLIIGCIMGTIVLLAVIVTMVIIVCHKNAKNGRVIHPPPQHTHNTLLFTSTPIVPTAPPAFYFGPPPPYPGSPIQSCNCSDTSRCEHVQHDDQNQQQQQTSDLAPQVLQEHYSNNSESYAYHRPVLNPFPVNNIRVIPAENPPSYSESIARDIS